MSLHFPKYAAGEGHDQHLIDLLDEPHFNEVDHPVFARAWAARQGSGQLEIQLPDDKMNYQQIFRIAFHYRWDGSDFRLKVAENLQKLVRDMNEAAIHGRPSYEQYDGTFSYKVGCMGGYRHYLGRDLEETDEIRFLMLQEPVLLLQRGAADLFNDYIHEGEWLCETSLWVKAG
jgi:hypothetical protein